MPIGLMLKTMCEAERRLHIPMRVDRTDRASSGGGGGGGELEAKQIVAVPVATYPPTPKVPGAAALTGTRRQHLQSGLESLYLEKSVGG